MVKVEVVTQTTYIINLPIESFSEIDEDHMKIKDSDKMIMEYLAEKLNVGVDKIISVNEI